LIVTWIAAAPGLLERAWPVRLAQPAQVREPVRQQVRRLKPARRAWVRLAGRLARAEPVSYTHLDVYKRQVFILWGARLAETVPGGMGDFKIDYHAARCLIEHCDPYSQSEFEADYRANGWEIPVSLPARQGALLYINLPAAFVLTVPFALLPWGPAHLLWMTATAGSLILAAFLMWSIGAVSYTHLRA